MAKTTTKSVGLICESEFYNTLDDIAVLTVKRDKAQAKLNKALLDARESYSPDVEEMDNQIKAKMAMAESFALRNRGTLLPKDAKSADSPKAKFGFRLGNPTLVLLSRKFTWGGVCDKLKALGKTMYLKLSDPKPDKDKIKADMTDEELASLGLRIEQTESFWVEPKTDDAERLTND